VMTGSSSLTSTAWWRWIWLVRKSTTLGSFFANISKTTSQKHFSSPILHTEERYVWTRPVSTKITTRFY
jgi:hypothetical protein